MAYELQDGQGTLFPNTDKKSDKSPDYSGSVKIEGKEYALAGWKKTSKNGRVFLSIKATFKDVDRPQPARQAPLDDDLPF